MSSSQSTGRVCRDCGARVVLGPRGYTHADGPDKHVPTPVRQFGGGPVFDQPSRGFKRASGDAALFKEGDGRHTRLREPLR